jgi:hypothetical protein
VGVGFVMEKQLLLVWIRFVVEIERKLQGKDGLVKINISVSWSQK